MRHSTTSSLERGLRLSQLGAVNHRDVSQAAGSIRGYLVGAGVTMGTMDKSGGKGMIR